jgi:alkylated DNA nucleotide flippase Atl1
MTIEEKVFLRRRFDRAKLAGYGFEEREIRRAGKRAVCMMLRREFMNGDFVAEITVDGGVTGRVIDTMNDEEYLPLRSPVYNGAYVNTVRAAYEELLIDIAEKCCTETVFAAGQSNRIAARILSEYGVAPDFPWDDDPYSAAGVFRHAGSRKWFGLIMTISRGKLVPGAGGSPVDVINLKKDEQPGDPSGAEPGVYPAYHMNHKKWISVTLDDTLSDDRVMELIDISYRLTAGRSAKTDDALIRQVFELVESIPPGHVATYGQIAKLIGRERNARLIGRIMSMADRYGDHPCHRVVASGGRTVTGWKEQREMLEAEGIGFKANGCVDMDRFQWAPEQEEQ